MLLCDDSCSAERRVRCVVLLHAGSGCQGVAMRWWTLVGSRMAIGGIALFQRYGWGMG